MISKVPFNFIFDHLPDDATVKPMFGMYAVYAGAKIVMILRKRETKPEVNGIWIATSAEHHAALKKALNITSLLIKEKESQWLLLPDNSKNFESSAIEVCRLIIRGDIRIGRIPERKANKKR